MHARWDVSVSKQDKAEHKNMTTQVRTGVRLTPYGDRAKPKQVVEHTPYGDSAKPD